MALAKKTCRVCGKTYEACRSARKDVGVFHWQEVACSPACGTEYLRKVNEARQPLPKAKRNARGRAQPDGDTKSENAESDEAE